MLLQTMHAQVSRHLRSADGSLRLMCEAFFKESQQQLQPHMAFGDVSTYAFNANPCCRTDAIALLT
jgi:hypothetical protein